MLAKVAEYCKTLPKMPKVAKHWQKLPNVGKSCQRLPNVAECFQKLTKGAKRLTKDDKVDKRRFGESPEIHPFGLPNIGGSLEAEGCRTLTILVIERLGLP